MKFSFVQWKSIASRSVLKLSRFSRSIFSQVMFSQLKSFDLEVRLCSEITPSRCTMNMKVHCDNVWLVWSSQNVDQNLNPVLSAGLFRRWQNGYVFKGKFLCLKGLYLFIGKLLNGRIHYWIALANCCIFCAFTVLNSFTENSEFYYSEIYAPVAFTLFLRINFVYN